MRIIALNIFLIFVSCTNVKNENTENRNLYYPKLIDSFGLHTLYDLGKWKIYHSSCLDSLSLPSYDISIPFAQLGITLDTLILTDSTTEITYKYLNLIGSAMPALEDFYMPDLGGFVFYQQTDSLIAFICKDDAGISFVPKITDTLKWLRMTKELTFEQKRSSSLFLYEPLQPEVVAYIDINRDNINRWFYFEAVKRGVIQKK